MRFEGLLLKAIDFLKKFANKFSKLTHKNHVETNDPIAHILQQIESLKKSDNYLDSLVVIWYRQFSSRKPVK